MASPLAAGRRLREDARRRAPLRPHNLAMTRLEAVEMRRVRLPLVPAGPGLGVAPDPARLAEATTSVETVRPDRAVALARSG
jgi:hypothetical protein